MDTDNTDQKNTPAPDAQAAGPATMQDLAATMGVSTSAGRADTSREDDADEQRRRVNDGRLKKASEDLAAANARIKELEEQIAKASAERQLFDAETVKKFAKDPDDVDDAFADTTAKGLNALRENVRKEMKGEFDALRAEISASREAASAARSTAALEQTLAAVEGEAPGLVARIARGDLKERWNSFLDGTDRLSNLPMRNILQGAMRDGRVDAAKEVYARFVREAGLSGQYAGAVMAPPRGAAPASPRTGAQGHVYQSRAEIYAEMERLSAAKRRGTIDQKQYVAKGDELENALREHRYLREK